MQAYFYATEAEKAGHYLIKTKRRCLGSLELKLSLLNDCTTCHTQASQVSIWLGDQSRSEILKGTIDKLPKPDEKFTNTMTY